MEKRLALFGAFVSIMMVFAAAGLAQTQTIDEVRCLLPEGCGPDVIDDEAGCTTPGGCVPDPLDEILCLLPEGCDMNGDGAPDLRAGDPVQGGGSGGGAGGVQYGNAY